MKKNIKIVILLLFSVGLFHSCKKNEGTPYTAYCLQELYSHSSPFSWPIQSDSMPPCQYEVKLINMDSIIYSPLVLKPNSQQYFLMKKTIYDREKPVDGELYI